MREQIGGKQLFVEPTSEGLAYYSYNKLVAKVVNMVLYITPVKYSNTASKHCNIIRKRHSDIPCK